MYLEQMKVNHCQILLNVCKNKSYLIRLIGIHYHSIFINIVVTSNMNELYGGKKWKQQ